MYGSKRLLYATRLETPHVFHEGHGPALRPFGRIIAPSAKLSCGKMTGAPVFARLTASAWPEYRRTNGNQNAEVLTKKRANLKSWSRR